MNQRTRRLLLNDACVAACINVAIGATITWLVFGRLHEVPVWGGSGLVFDAIPSTFMPVLGLCFGVSSAIRKRSNAGRLAGIDSDLIAPAWMRWMPKPVVLRALCLATLTTAIVLPLTALGFRIFAVESLVLPVVFALKVGQLAMIGLLLGPIVAYRALLDRTPCASVGQHA
jgi:hypothetical protein